ncbi:MAG: hypothetical protein WC175_02455 [Candidatus Dojkabacteria bacterium]
MADTEKIVQDIFSVDMDPTLVQYTTKNVSFLSMYKYLKSRGKKNNKFFLRLYDKELMTVNPYKVDSDELKARILREVSINPWYFYREIYRIPEAGGYISFQLHKGNLAQLFLSHLNISFILELPRQTGKQTSCPL